MIGSPSMFGALRDLANNNVQTLVTSGNPVDGAAGTGANIAGPGTKLIDVATGFEYFNIGTLAAPVWAAGIKQARGFISPANIVGTGAGQFGHANGVVLVAPQGALVGVELVSVLMNYRFATAAYTGGGNVTVNNAAGGAALTGLVSAANSIANAASKDLIFVPLSTVAIPVVRNGGLNLVSSAAFTQPGTAAGVISWVCNYRTYTLDVN